MCQGLRDKLVNKGPSNALCSSYGLRFSISQRSLCLNELVYINLHRGIYIFFFTKIDLSE